VFTPVKEVGGIYVAAYCNYMHIPIHNFVSTPMTNVTPNSSRAKHSINSKEENHDEFKNCSHVTHAPKLCQNFKACMEIAPNLQVF
jgi:methylthioribose-1-phosphate isomerase